MTLWKEVAFAKTYDGLNQLVRRVAPREEGARGRAWGSLVLVHGIGEHSGRYEHVGEALAGQGLRVLTFDLRGHGASEGRRVYVRRFQEYLDDLAWRMKDARQAWSGETWSGEALDERAPLFLYGHSMGGLIALLYVLQRTEPAPQALVLSAPALAAETPTWQRVLAPILSRALPALPVPAPVHLEQLSRDPSVGKAYAADPLVQRVATTRLGDELFGAMKEARLQLQELTLPTLVLHGGDDTLVPTRVTEVLGTMSNVTRIVYDGLRHEVHNESERERVFQDVVTFLEGHSSLKQPRLTSEIRE